MPLVVSSALAGSMLVYQVINEMKDGLNRISKIIDEVVADGFLTSLSTSSVIFIVINSLIAAYHNDEIPDAAFYAVMSLCVTLMALTTTSSVIHYRYAEDEHQPETDSLLAHSDTETENSYHPDATASRQLTDVTEVDDADAAEIKPRIEVLDESEQENSDQAQPPQPTVTKVSFFATKETEEVKTEIVKSKQQDEKSEDVVNPPKINK